MPARVRPLHHQHVRPVLHRPARRRDRPDLHHDDEPRALELRHGAPHGARGQVLGPGRKQPDGGGTVAPQEGQGGGEEVRGEGRVAEDEAYAERERGPFRGGGGGGGEGEEGAGGGEFGVEGG